MSELRRACLGIALLLACDGEPAPQRAGSPLFERAEAAALSAVPHRTTRGDLAVRNLHDRIATLDERLGRGPGPVDPRPQLVDALLTRAQFLGTFSDLARARVLAEQVAASRPRDPEAWLARARAASAAHRFEDAVRDLEEAARRGADVSARLAMLRIAQGRQLEEALELARVRAARAPTLEHLTLRAAAEAALGNFEAADEAYAAALGTLRGVSPFPVAQLSFARGVMWAEQADDAERALPHYLEAVRRLPQYVTANVHLAELEAAHGRADAARARLHGLLAYTEDPEPAGRLGELLPARAAGGAPAGTELIARARASYERLLGEQRAAFLDHASEFFAGPGADAPLALRLAQENLALRRTPRAYSLAIEAAFAARNRSVGCLLLEEASAQRELSKNLAALIEREHTRCASP